MYQMWLTPVRWTQWAAVTERWTKDVIAGWRTEAALLSHTNWVSAGFWTAFSLTHLNSVLLKMVWPIVKSFPFYFFPSFLSCIFCFFLPYNTSIIFSFLSFSPVFFPSFLSLLPFRLSILSSFIALSLLLHPSITPSIHPSIPFFHTLSLPVPFLLSSPSFLFCHPCHSPLFYLF